MNRILTLTLLALTVFTGSQALAAIEIGQPAPDFTLLSASGEEVTLSELTGKYVVLEWTNDGCPYVQKLYNSGKMQELQQKYTDKDVVWLSVISSAPGKQGHVSAAGATALSEERNAVPSEVLLDESGDVGRLYAAKTTPHMYIIDPQGALQYAGAIDSIRSANVADVAKATNYVDEGLTALLAGEAPAETVTRPYGCSVKYGS